MDSNKLQIFLYVARAGSIAAAARVAQCDPSVVSRAVQSLEAELGIRLFQRTTRLLRLTEAGSRYLQRIEPLLEELSAAHDETRSVTASPSGRLRISASSSFGLTVVAPVLASFRGDYTNVHIDLMLEDTLTDLVSDGIDVAIRLGPRPSGDFVASRLASISMRTVASNEYVRSHPKITSPADLGAHTCLLTVPQRSTTWIFRKSNSDTTVSVAGVISTSNTLVLRRCALDGLGVAVLPGWLVDQDIAAGGLEQLLPSWKVAVRSFETAVWLLYPSRTFLPLKTRLFIDHFKKATLTRL